MRVDVLGLGFDNVDMAQAVESALGLLKSGGGHYVVTPNSEIVVDVRRDAAARAVFQSADLVLPDGAGVLVAAKLLRRPLTARVAGVDFAQSLMAQAKGLKLYLLGGAEGVAEQAGQRLAERYPDLNIVGVHNGYFNGREAEVDADIKRKDPDILFVCLGAPKQENWMYTHREDFGDCLMVGLGGCLDVWSGRVERAPQWYQTHNLEWFYRLCKQPSRLGRMMKLPYFLWLAVLERVKKA
ncbi:N-acetylmannosaminyltransferase [Clostridia bacterium]|nr:N-acetylmannosaminyltransferase [Clostridia bacterium]